MRSPFFRLTVLSGLLIASLSPAGSTRGESSPADWPMWCRDAGRTSATPERPADDLTLRWVWRWPRRTAAFAADPVARPDAGHLPVVAGPRGGSTLRRGPSGR